MSDTYDYLIVGGGTAGCILASRLSEDPSVRVALLEAGADERGALIRCPAGVAWLARSGRAQWDFGTLPQPGLNGRSTALRRGKLVGGSSAIGRMVYARGLPADHDRWAADGNPGWAFADMLPYYRRVEDGSSDTPAALDTVDASDASTAAQALRARDGAGPLGITAPPRPHPASLAFVQAAQQVSRQANCGPQPERDGPAAMGMGLHRLTQRSGERASAATAYLAPHLHRTNLTLITGAQASRVLMEGRRAVGIEFGHDGYLKQLRASGEVLLCAGALQSPQLLMLSGIGPHAHLLENGIATRHHLPGVGQHLRDQPAVALRVLAPGAASLPGFSPGGLLRLGRALAEWRRHRAGPLTSNLTEAGGPVRSRAEEPVPDVDLQFSLVQGLAGPRAVPRRGFAIEVRVLRPQSRGRVLLDGKDAFSPPLIDPDYLGDREDMERLLRGFCLARELMGAPALAGLGGRELPASARASGDLPLEQFIRDHAGTGHAPAGSCRMGQGPLDVVDACLRVHGVAGLRVVDASVMPHLGAAGTFGPVCVLAEKAADLIRHARARPRP